MMVRNRAGTRLLTDDMLEYSVARQQFRKTTVLVLDGKCSFSAIQMRLVATIR